MEDKYYALNEILQTAREHNIAVYVDYRLGKKTSFRVVMTEESNQLFAKEKTVSRYDKQDSSFKLCNEFSKLKVHNEE